MLTAAIAIPLIGALLLAVRPGLPERAVRAVAAVAAGLPLAVLIGVWADFDEQGPRLQYVTDLPWIPAIGAGYRLGVDGIALALSLVSALLFTAAVVYPVDHRGRARQYAAWMLFLEAVTLGLFLTLDLLMFYVFFDLSLVGMYFLIGIWGHEDRRRAALKFILYTLAGSLVMLLGILSLVLAADPITFDMRALSAAQPLAGGGLRASLTMAALLFGLLIKTPLVPVHTWLPPAHVEAPAPASAILAGVLLKMGTYGILRIPLAMMQETFREWAFGLAILATVSIVYGAFVALGQGHLKRRVAYTSITHMGYTILGISVASLAGSQAVRDLALTGATLEMVAHALITGALFFITGSVYQRGHGFEIGEYGGIASRAPRLTAAAFVAAFASLGLPGLAGFVAELQIFAAAVATTPWLAGIALIGVLVTAALFLQLLQRMFLGKRTERVEGMTDLGPIEMAVLGGLLGLTVWIGVAPAPVVDLIMQGVRLLALGPG